MRAFMIWGAALALALGSFSAAAADLRVSIQGVASSSGTLMIGLYDSEDHFRLAVTHAGKLGLLNDNARLIGIAMRAIAGTQSVVFTNLNPGRYAVIAFHDENDNSKLDEDWLGIPTEGYGFSNDAEGFLSAPSFEKAAVTLDVPDRAIAITLKYPGGHRAGKRD